MNVKDTYRHFLRNGENSMLKVSCHLFTRIGNGLEWQDGELVYSEKDGFRDFYKPRKNPVTPEKRKTAEAQGLCDLYNSWDMEHQAYLLKRKFVLDNIETILDSPVSSRLFESDKVHSHYLVNPATDYALSVVFPDDIQPDWAKAVYDFNQWWLTNLRLIHGVGHNGNTDFWPESIQEAYWKIELAMQRAFKIMTGISYDTYHDQLIAEFISETD